MTTKELFKKIDNLRIRTADYQTVLLMLNNMSNEMFTKCIEEIVNGNLYFSDFTDVLAGSGYDRALTTIFKNQYDLGEFIQNTKALREDLLIDPYDPGNFLKTAVGIDRIMVSDIKQRIEEEFAPLIEKLVNDWLKSLNLSLNDDRDDYDDNSKNIIFEEYKKYVDPNKPTIDDYSAAIIKVIEAKRKTLQEEYGQTALLENIDNFYNTEYQMLRDDVMYQITQPKLNDSLLVRSVKATLYKNLINGSQTGTITDSEDAVGILLSLQDYILPIQSDFQMLTDADTAFMNENNLTEKQMKDMKTVAMFIQQKDINKNYEEILTKLNNDSESSSS